MRKLLFALTGALLIMTTSSAQQIQPGDRPSGNLRGTRSPAVGRHGMIATSQSLASAAGLKVLQDGGNAIDAAVTAAAVLAVVEPSMNGIGGDLLAIVYDAKTEEGLRSRFNRPIGLRGNAGGVRQARPEGDAGQRPAHRRRARRGRRLAPVAHALRHHLAGQGHGAGHCPRARRLPGGRIDGQRVVEQREAAGARPGDGRHVPADGQADASRATSSPIRGWRAASR